VRVPIEFPVNAVARWTAVSQLLASLTGPLARTQTPPAREQQKNCKDALHLKFSVVRVYITVEAEALRARHGDIAQNGCDNREINRHASAECAGDVDDLARTRADAAQIRPGLRETIAGARRTNTAELARRLNSTMECLHIARPDIYNTKSLSLVTCTIWSLSRNPK